MSPEYWKCHIQRTGDKNSIRHLKSGNNGAIEDAFQNTEGKSIYLPTYIGS